MLCRAALAALAVTCTLPPLAIAQGTELVQLKDLVCVLWFSGLKKEDIDVNLLTKLERHKINFDMRNETMQQECSKNTQSLTGQTETTMTTTITTSTTTEFPKIINTATKDKYMEPFMKFMNDFSKMSKNYMETERNEKMPTLPPTEKTEKSIMFEPIYSAPDKLSEGYLMKIEPTQERTKVDTENILSLWKKIANSKDKQTRKEYKVTSQGEDMSRKKQIIKTKPVTSRPYNPFDLITKDPVVEHWLADYIDKRINRMPITTTTTQKAIPRELGQFILPYYKDLFHTYNSRQIEQDTVNGEDKDLFNKFTIRNRGIQTITQTNEPDKSDVLLKNPNRENIGKKKTTSTKGDESLKIPKQTLQEIADKIKAMILKDLGPLAKFTTAATPAVTLPPPTTTKVTPPPTTTKITPPPTTTKVTLPPTTTTVTLPPMPTTAALPIPLPTIPNVSAISTTKKNVILNDVTITTSNKSQNLTGNVYQVMEKIMDLYERVKSISDKINITKEAPNNPDKHNAKLLVNNPIKEEIKVPDTLQRDMFNRMTNVKHLLMNPFRDLTRQEIQSIPSIIQTNSGEIAPLMLPMANPLRIVNQILVVTTANPTTKVIEKRDKIKSRYEKFMEGHKNRNHASYNRNRSQKLPIPSLDHKTTYSADHKTQPSFSNLDTNRYTKDIPIKHSINHDLFERPRNYRSRNTGRINENLKYNRNDENYENTEHINYFKYISSQMAKVPANRHREKFHEILETDDGRQDDNASSLGNNKELFGKSQHFVGQHKELFGQSKDTVGQNKDLFQESKDIVGQHRDLFREKFEKNRELFRQDKELMGQNHKNVVVHDKELGQRILGQSKDIFGHIKKMLGNDWEPENENPVMSRHQQPLNAKNAYDDTHFKNFLKTQQKVNDMLQIILETKSNLPFSVETT